METLHDSKPSLFITNPESDPSPPAAEAVQKHDTLSRSNTVAVSSHGAQDASRANGRGLIGDPSTDKLRFGFQYTDPLFPTKDVPYGVVKRFFDLMIAFMILIPASPFMIIAAILVKLTSKGPVVFKQVRVGRGGRYFWCYKFRSMCADAEAKKQMLMHLNEASGPVFKIKRDPRITPVGAVLRKFSIDELPQLFNVIKGDMSIVGPRPPLPSEVALYTARDRGRLAVRPGLTCLWQVNGRSNVSFDRWVELDLAYIETMSFVNDVKIVLKTVPAVLKGSGAH